MQIESARAFKAEIRARFEHEASTRSADHPLGGGPEYRGPAGAPTVALGVGVRKEGDYHVAVRIQDEQAAAILDIDRLRDEAKGEIDVKFIGELRPFQVPWHQQRQRPLAIGASVAHHAVTAGTIGAFVRTADGRPAILSNNHVLANVNDASEGDAVLQPGAADGGNTGDRVATLHSFIVLQAGQENYVDAALATIDDGIDHDPKTISGLGSLSGTASYYDTQLVSKTGRTTGTTAGFISAVEIDYAVVSYGPQGFMPFDDQIEIQSLNGDPFSEPGDSGSLIVDSNSTAAVALLFAGNVGTGVTFASPIDRVLQELGAALP